MATTTRPRRGDRVRLIDVARVAGVHHTTVSAVLNSPVAHDHVGRGERWSSNIA